jgi:hypothetical protein
MIHVGPYNRAVSTSPFAVPQDRELPSFLSGVSFPSKAEVQLYLNPHNPHGPHSLPS